MENKAHAFVAGAFVLGMVAAVVAVILWFTHDRTVRHTYELSTGDPVSGLQPQAIVRYRGIAVGKVVSIDFDPEVRGNVRVRITVDQRVPLTHSSYAALSYQGVTGLAFIALDDSGESKEPLQPNESDPPNILLKPSTFAMLQERGEAILDKVDQAATRLNTLIGAENQQRVANALENIAQASASAGQLTRRIDAAVQTRLGPALDALPPTLGSVKTAAGDVSRAANTLQGTVARLNEKDGALDRITASTQDLAQTLETLNSATLPRIHHAAEEATHAVRQLGRAAETVGDNPQSLIYGSGGMPGPGEPGFAAPTAPAATP